MKTHPKIAAAFASLGLLSACGDQNDAQPRDATDAGEPVGQVGTLTDVPTSDGAAMQGGTTTAPSGAGANDPQTQRQNPPQTTTGSSTTSPGAAAQDGSTSSPQ